MPRTHTTHSNPTLTYSNPSLARRAVLALAVVGVMLGSMLTGAGVAEANDTKKFVLDEDTVLFTTFDSSRGVRGDVALIVRRNGNWAVAGEAYNSNLWVRNVRWSCDLTLDSVEVEVKTARNRVPGKKERTLVASAYNPFIQNNFDDIIDRGRADCDIVVG